ncbi:hypothetical protein ACK8HX_07325 [Oryzobacter sp. R7]|uniref:hypothetical protein n=1 Tax=Oryzobacter faecalis TaxID=3388656 RepID=UPI00398CD7DE
MASSVARTYLSVRDVAALVEVAALDADRAELLRRCRVATELGAATLLCRPEDVPTAVCALGGSGVVVGTTVGAEEAGHDELLAEAARACDAGARQVALPVSGADLGRGGIESLAGLVRAVAAVAAPAELKVGLPGGSVPVADLQRAAATASAAGALIVSVGLWSGGDRARLASIRPIRQALGPDKLLKWTHRVTSLDRLLLAHSEGADLFNADLEVICAEARGRVQNGGIRVPVPGVDYIPGRGPETLRAS